MIEAQLNQRFLPRDYTIFGGLDVDKTSISVTFLSHEQKVKSMRIPYDAQHLLNYVRNHFPNEKVAFTYEAGPTGYGLYDSLAAQGHPCLVVAPSMVPTAPGHHVKTNRLDSVKLAENLRGGQLRSIHVPSGPYRELRHLTQLRDTFVRQVVAAKCRIKALLLMEGIPFPQTSSGDGWSMAGLKQLKKISANGSVSFKLNRLISSLEFSRKNVLETTKEIRRFCRQDPEVQRCLSFLMSIPGIGTITGSQLLARIGDWRFLSNVRQLAAFLGLAQSENSTGDDTNRGTITRAGDSRLRSKLVQCAWAAIRRDPELRKFYRRIYERHPKDRAAKKAIVAVARKMTTRIYAVLSEQRNYVIRHEISSRPLIQEETVCPRERLDHFQNQETSLDGSVHETESPGQTVALDAAHLKTVRQSSNCATDCRKSFLRSERDENAGRGDKGL